MGTDVEASRTDDEERVRIAWHILTALHAAGFSAELVVADDAAIEVVPLIPDWETGFSESAAHRAGARRRRAAPSLSEGTPLSTVTAVGRDTVLRPRT